MRSWNEPEILSLCCTKLLSQQCYTVHFEILHKCMTSCWSHLFEIIIILPWSSMHVGAFEKKKNIKTALIWLFGCRRFVAQVERDGSMWLLPKRTMWSTLFCFWWCVLGVVCSSKIKLILQKRPPSDKYMMLEDNRTFWKTVTPHPETSSFWMNESMQQVALIMPLLPTFLT